jgi:hypothetical protein
LFCFEVKLQNSAGVEELGRDSALSFLCLVINQNLDLFGEISSQSAEKIWTQKVGKKGVKVYRWT